MSKALLAIDQGTTSTRTLLFSPDGEILNLQQKELQLIMPYKGWVEQDPQDIRDDTFSLVQAAVTYAEKNGIEIAGIGITNQRETTIVWDRATGEPVYNAIVWQDRRTAELCKAQKSHEKTVSEKTGLLIDPYFSGTKIAWILDNVDGVRARAEAGELAFGTIDTFLLWHLSGGKIHRSDVTNASRTMLYNVVENKWDDELLELLNVPRSLLPEVCENVFDFGAAEINGKTYTVGGMAGDQQAALIGQACFHPGMVKSTYGTGCFALANIGTNFKTSQNKLLTTIAYKIDSVQNYAIEGSIFVAGAAIQWLRDGLELFDIAAKSEALATSVPDNGGVYFVPALAGLGAPYWQPEATGMITGITRDSTKAHVARAALEAQGFQTLDLMDAMEADAEIDIRVIRADGGLTANNFMCQFLSDILDKEVEVPAINEATAWGAACLAGLQVGVFSSLDDVAQRWQRAKDYKPVMDAGQREVLRAGWRDAIHKVLN